MVTNFMKIYGLCNYAEQYQRLNLKIAKHKHIKRICAGGKKLI